MKPSTKPNYFRGKETYAFVQAQLRMLEDEGTGRIRYVLNEVRLREVEKAYRILQELILQYDPKAVIKIEACELEKGVLAIDIITFDFAIRNLPTFFDAVKSAATFSCWARTDGYVYVGLTFEGVAIPYLANDSARN